MAQRTKTHTGFGVQIKILGISHGGQHTAQVCSHSLQDHQGDHQMFLVCQAQDDETKGYKGNEGDVVGDHHTQEKRKQHQHQHHLPGRIRAFEQLIPQIDEQAGLLKSLHHGH